MFAVGAFYLIFEEQILANTESQSGSVDAKTHLMSRLILSVQVRGLNRIPVESLLTV